jgi:cobalt-precorrin 5A hydrolase/precorrin-3B C17-methyltransferase
MFYGSFMYIFERLGGRHRTVVVPGVSSLTAVAAAAGTPLVGRNDVLTIIPAPLPEADLTRLLAATDAASIMKVGRHLGKVRRVLRGLGLEDDAWYVERATMANERVLPLGRIADAEAPYFSMILVRRPGKHSGQAERGERAGVAAAAKRTAGAAEAPVSDAALIALTAEGGVMARRLMAILPGSRVHGLAGRVDGADVVFADTGRHLRALFADGRPIVGICAAGILIRALAPVLGDKGHEPPVLALAEDASAVVPLLGGHRGANRIARAIAAATGAVAAVTTGGDLRYGLALDDPPPGWRIANPSAAKAVAAALLAEQPVALVCEAGDAGWLLRSGASFEATGAASGAVCVRITDHAVVAGDMELVLYPPVLAVGVGCERGAAPADLVALVDATLRRAGLAPASVACVASIDVKTDEAAVHALAEHLGVPARFFAAAELEAEAPRLRNPSDAVFRAVGCHGVAEGAALAAAGGDSRLIVEKARGIRATCAVARAALAIDSGRVGRARGRLTVVGIGPGDAAWRTPAASRALDEATDVVGYGLYLDLIADALEGKQRHGYGLTEEETRVRAALDLAAEGRSVALVSSGDAGVYGLAALVFELLDREDRPEWNRLAIAVVPGISALQAAAARIGAPIGHDFCAISLSDLLTPWPDIARRLKAAAEGDFVLALYNPVSRRRRSQLEAARAILLGHRAPETPVVLARNLGRENETIAVIRLDELHADRADMLTLVLIGSARTRLIARGGGRWVYTPRGYAQKIDAEKTGGQNTEPEQETA